MELQAIPRLARVIAMQSRFSRALVVCGVVLVSMASAPLFAATPYAITATNVTLTRTGSGTSQFTVTGIPMTGMLEVACQYQGPSSTTVKAPVCPFAGRVIYSVQAGASQSGTIMFVPPTQAVPASAPAEGAALGVLLLAWGTLQRGRKWLLLAIVCVACLVPISSCGGSSNGMTPGSYPFTISANNESNPMTPLGQGVTTNITVTVQ